MKKAVIYHYYELNNTYKENLVYFLNTAIIEDIEYFFYISGSCSVELLKLKNIHYIYIENKNNDFGGVVEFSKHNKSLNFDVYLFINSSMRGPFMSPYHPTKWYEVFTSKLSHKVAMAGSSINLLPEEALISSYFKERFDYDPPYIHVQTTAYALSSRGYQLLLNKGFFDVDETLNKNDIISRYEILLSQILLNNGLSITSILQPYEEFSFSKRNSKFLGTNKQGDSLYKGAFYGRTLTPIESVFIKTSRNLVSDRELASYTFTALSSKEPDLFLTKEGLDLFQNSFKKLQAKESITITIKQLKQFLKNIKKNDPGLSKELRELL